MIVVDCSVVVDALVGSDADMLDEVLTSTRLAAPSLIDFEIVAAVRGLVLGGQLSPHRAHEALDDYGLLPITRWRSAHDLRQRAVELRDNITAYDAAYVALAEALDCPFLTRDRKLATAAKDLIEVIVA